jgi:hypothetical protein
MDVLPPEIVSSILDELSFVELKALRGVCKFFYQEYSKRCNWYIKTRIQDGEILPLDANPYMSFVAGGIMFFYHENFPEYLVKGKKLRKDGWFVELTSSREPARSFTRKLVYDKDGMLVANRVYYNYRINFH